MACRSPPSTWRFCSSSPFSVRLGWLPAIGGGDLYGDPIGSLRYLVLPTLTLGLIMMASRGAADPLDDVERPAPRITAAAAKAKGLSSGS